MEEFAARLATLRRRMADAAIDWLIVPKADSHHVEWLRPETNLVARFCGFGGSYARLLVSADRAILMTSGIYAEAAARQFVPLGFEIVDDSSRPLGSWCATELPHGAIVGLDPWLHTDAELASLREAILAAGATVSLLADNPVDAVSPRPPVATVSAWPHPLRFAGEDATAKRVRIAREIGTAGGDACLISAPDSICWLLNIRGADVFDTPLVYAFALLHRDATATLFVDPAKVDAGLAAHLGDAVRIRAYDAVGDAFEAAPAIRTVLLDRTATSHALVARAAAAGITVIDSPDPCQLAKCIKNPVELAGARKAHVRDGIAQARFWSWWSRRIAAGAPPSEGEAEDRIDALRGEQDLHRGVSFRTISAAGGHASMPHYHSDRAITVPLAMDNLFLLDSGGQYDDGTTDVTRTYAVGRPDHETQLRYTQVMQGLIAANGARFPSGTRGFMIDAFARQPLWAEGLDYAHGTGHGVGAFLGVHEYPVRLRTKPDPTPLMPGMITSVEPGYYAPGRFGIRHENLVAVVEDETNGFLRFEALTLCPFDVAPLLVERLSAAEIAWLDAYHAKVLETLHPLLDGDALDWLEARTRPVIEQRRLWNTEAQDQLGSNAC